MSDQLDADTSTRQHTTSARYINAQSGTLTHNPNKRAPTDPRLKPRDHWDRHGFVFSAFKLPVQVLHTFHARVYCRKFLKQKTNFKTWSEYIWYFGILNFALGKCGVASSISAHRKLFANI
jgi:hypothetical protein